MVIVTLANVMTDCLAMELIVTTHATHLTVRITRLVSTLEITLTHADVIRTISIVMEHA